MVLALDAWPSKEPPLNFALLPDSISLNTITLVVSLIVESEMSVITNLLESFVAG